MPSQIYFLYIIGDEGVQGAWISEINDDYDESIIPLAQFDLLDRITAGFSYPGLQPKACSISSMNFIIGLNINVIFCGSGSQTSLFSFITPND